MEMKIDERGCLHIKRGGKWRASYCPYATRGIPIECSDTCALFGEPVTDRFVNEDGRNESETYLDLCRKSLYGTITDERKGEER